MFSIPQQVLGGAKMGVCIPNMNVSIPPTTHTLTHPLFYSYPSLGYASVKNCLRCPSIH